MAFGDSVSIQNVYTDGLVHDHGTSNGLNTTVLDLAIGMRELLCI